jgi:hypothetical protein
MTGIMMATMIILGRCVVLKIDLAITVIIRMKIRFGAPP